MKHVVENGHCTIYHTRTYTKKPGKGSVECMLLNHNVHVLSILIHMDGDRRRKNNDRVLVHVRLWMRHTAHFEILKVEKVSLVNVGRDELIMLSGNYLWFFWKQVYDHIEVLS